MIFKKRKQKIKIYYICQYVQGYSKISDIINLMIDEDEIDFSLLAFPEIIDEFPENNELSFWKDKFGESVINAIVDNNWYDLKKNKPDYVFVQRPYDDYLPDEYACKELSKYTKVCYIPYAFSLANLHNISLQRSFLEKIYMIFSENYDEYEYSKKIIDNFKDGKKRFCFNLGYPSLDIIKNNTKNNSAFNEIKNRNLHIIWTPRWTTDESACGTTFFEYKDKIIKYGKKQRDLIVFRPHPLAFDNFIEKGLMTKKEVTDYLKNYQNSNMIYDKSSDYYDTFRDSDVLITDFSSIIIEYLMYNKPIIFCHRNMDMMNDYMKRMSKVLYHAKNWKEIEKILKMLKSGKDPLKKERIEFIEKNFSMYDGKVKNRIVDQIKKDYYKKK